MWCTVWDFQKAVNSLLIVKETTAVSGPAGPRGPLLFGAMGVTVMEGEGGGRG